MKRRVTLLWGWHDRAVLCVRSELLRARCNSGMRDSAAAQVEVPEQFSRPAVDAFMT